MEQTAFTLLATIASAALALLFAIIGVAAPGWLGGARLFNCGVSCPNNNIAAGVLLIIAIVFLFLSVVAAVILRLRYAENQADFIKFVVLFLLFIASIFIVAAYSSVYLIKGYKNYSYHLSTTAGVLAFLSTLFFSYYMGRSSVFLRP